MKLKNLFFVLLALALVLSLGVCAAAEGGGEPAIYVSGTCGLNGNNLTWTLSTDGVLTISGTGEMKGYHNSQPNMAPWYKSSGAHTDYPDVVKVVVEENVTTIGDYAFHGLRQLSEVTLPSTVTHLGELCFSGCESLETLELPAGLTKIDLRAFCQAEGLTHITIPAGVTAIDPQAFANCEKLTSITLPNGVTTIGYSAFSSCLALEEIDLPSGITSIGRGAFFNCVSLQHIKLPNQLTEIPESAFDECYALTSVTIPESVTIIGEEAFQNCTALCSVNGYGIANLPDSITEIGAKAFRFCHSLEYVDLPENITEIKDWTFYATGLRQITIPANLRSIGESAFGSYADYDEQMLARVYINMTEETWRSEVTIGEYNDRLLRAKYIRYFFSGDGAAVVETRQIGPDVYYTLYENGHADIYGNGDTYASPDDSHSYFADSINWQIPVPVTSVEVKSGVTGLIDEYGLGGLRELQSVKLPASLVSIAPDMFYFCIGLESLELDPENPVYTAVDDVLFNKEMTELIQYPLGKKDKTYTVPAGVETIVAKAFCEIQYLEEVTLPDSVRTIGRQAFEEAKVLNKVDLGKGVEFIDECAFFRVNNIPVITVPGSVKHICNWAFGFRPDFTDVYYPCPKEAWDEIEIGSENGPLLNATFHYGEHAYDDGVITVYPTETTGGEMTYTCTACGHSYTDTVPATPYQDWLYTESYPTENGQIGEHVYYTTYNDGHVSIYGTGDTYPTSHYVPYDYYYHPLGGNPTSIEVHEGVTGLMCKGMFCNYPQLEYVKLPASLTYIESMVFDTIQVLTAVDVAAANPSYTSQNGILFNKDMTTLLVYPSGKTENSYTVPDGVEIIGEMAFHKNPVLKTVTMPDSVKEIGNTAFNSSVLETVNLGNGLETIERFAFSNCRNLESILIPGSVKTIGTGAFHYNDNFKDVYYPCPKEAWDKIEIGPVGMNSDENDELLNATFHFGEHAYDDGVITTLATYFSDGVKTYTCMACGNSCTETVPRLGEDDYDWMAIPTSDTGLQHGALYLDFSDAIEEAFAPEARAAALAMVNAGEWYVDYSRMVLTGAYTAPDGTGGLAVVAPSRALLAQTLREKDVVWITLPYGKDGLQDGDWYLDLDAFVDAVGRGKTEAEKAEVRDLLLQHVTFSYNPGGSTCVYRFAYTNLPVEDSDPITGSVILPLDLALETDEAFPYDYNALQNCVLQYHAPDAPESKPDEQEDEGNWFQKYIIRPMKSAISSILSFFRKLFKSKK